MKIIACLLILFIGVAFGAISAGFFSSPEHPGKCVIDGTVYEPGTHNNPSETKCSRIQCKETGFAEIASCGVEVFPDNCKVEGFKDVSRPYPECCERKVTCTG